MCADFNVVLHYKGIFHTRNLTLLLAMTTYLEDFTADKKITCTGSSHFACNTRLVHKESLPHIPYIRLPLKRIRQICIVQINLFNLA